MTIMEQEASVTFTRPRPARADIAFRFWICRLCVFMYLYRKGKEGDVSTKLRRGTTTKDFDVILRLVFHVYLGVSPTKLPFKEHCVVPKAEGRASVAYIVLTPPPQKKKSARNPEMSGNSLPIKVGDKFPFIPYKPPVKIYFGRRTADEQRKSSFRVHLFRRYKSRREVFSWIHRAQFLSNKEAIKCHRWKETLGLT